MDPTIGAAACRIRGWTGHASGHQFDGRGAVVVAEPGPQLTEGEPRTGIGDRIGVELPTAIDLQPGEHRVDVGSSRRRRPGVQRAGHRAAGGPRAATRRRRVRRRRGRRCRRRTTTWLPGPTSRASVGHIDAEPGEQDDRGDHHDDRARRDPQETVGDQPGENGSADPQQSDRSQGNRRRGVGDLLEPPQQRRRQGVDQCGQRDRRPVRRRGPPSCPRP